MADVLVDVTTKYDNKGIKKLSKEGDKLAKKSAKWGKALKGVGLGAAAGFGLASAAAIKFGSDSVNLAREQIAVEKQLETVLESTGNAAGLTADEIKEMASELQTLTNFGDEATLSGQNMLLTFTNIGAETFPRATAAMLDMSVAMDQDLKSSAQQIGKALNDPIAGVGALSRVGVQFTEDQKGMIASLVETGDVAGAQAIILTELETQFQGSAAAAREADGGFIAAKNAIGDLQEEVGRGILAQLSPMMEGIAQSVAEVTPEVSELTQTFFGELGPALGDLGAAGTEFAIAFGLAEEGATGLEAAVSVLSKVLEGFLSLIEFITRGLEGWARFKSNFDEIGKLLNNASAADIIKGIGGAQSAVGIPSISRGLSNIGVPGFADGGGFTVGGTGGADSQLVQFRATPGEQVNITNNINGIGGTELGQLIRGAIEGALSEYTDNILVPSFS